MFALVADTAVKAGELVRRGPTQFGQDVPGWSVAPYCLHVPVEHLVTAFEPVFDAFLNDGLADVRNGSDDWPEIETLVAAGCPPLSEIPMRLPGLLAEILRESLYMDVLDALLPLRPDAAIRYLANTVDHVTVDPDWVAVCGRALQVPEAVPNVAGRRLGPP
ncbi:hypothetical protein [Micromonospora andamanensis]|uniref:hypothetical protein n=1 Tax=Micromonospora andamanensis TaxID=1287068 RepID=UPI00194F9669|nr:hypothetical protein [Micromonospora andamanensis]